MVVRITNTETEENCLELWSDKHANNLEMALNCLREILQFSAPHLNEATLAAGYRLRIFFQIDFLKF